MVGGMKSGVFVLTTDGSLEDVAALATSYHLVVQASSMTQQTQLLRPDHCAHELIPWCPNYYKPAQIFYQVSHLGHIVHVSHRRSRTSQ